MSQAAPESLATRSLGDIAASIPGSTAVFRRHKLDFCCGGSESLERAARKKGLDPASIEAELSRLAPQQNSVPESVEDLIGYILQRYHQVHRQELPELRNLAIRVERVHVDHPAVPAGLSDLLERMQANLESHMQKEEQVLFPLMRAGGNPMIVHPIGMMRHEHDEHGEELRALAALTGDMTAPDGACNSWRALYAVLAKLAEDLTDHIHIENNVLFPRFEA
ncbi:MAG: iron-sulfur cluster repair protein YtfE [Xanthobacteraceae bacterium]|jgi:regulator of cell morphogenesis and NO signaling